MVCMTTSSMISMLFLLTMCFYASNAFSPKYPVALSMRSVTNSQNHKNRAGELEIVSRSRLQASPRFDTDTVKRGIASVLLIGSLASGSNVVGAFESPAYAPQTVGVNHVLVTGQSAPSRDLLSLSSSSVTMADTLSAKPKPTAEEIKKKKDNFNFWFWGGGFVAPFLATFYYFGLKFWEK
ncbi:hypothetical protein TrCOL_g9737 [Triparma columacea]|uniref:Uncharacterized protein n=1 Tax=Triparma columacea TaxID=722753 RepID=A0A9W7FWX8_9STRA|nr:hypothetical protein TrCOL_g9737 [Triparma columacea]